MSQALATITQSRRPVVSTQSRLIRPDPRAGVSYHPIEHYLPRNHAANMLAQPGWRFILALVSLKHGVLQRDILGPYRNRRFVAARYEALALTYQHTRLSMPALGALFNRDHTTVLYALRKMGVDKKLVPRRLPVPERPYMPASFISGHMRHQNGRFAPTSHMEENNAA